MSVWPHFVFLLLLLTSVESEVHSLKCLPDMTWFYEAESTIS